MRNLRTLHNRFNRSLGPHWRKYSKISKFRKINNSYKLVKELQLQ